MKLEEIEDLKRIQFIYLPPYGPDKNPIEHVWNEVKNSISNLQCADFEDTRDALETFIRATKFKYILTKLSC
jgi:transposase of ISAar31, IS630 family